MPTSRRRWNIDERLDAVVITDAEKSDAINRMERDLRALRARENAAAKVAAKAASATVHGPACSWCHGGSR
jgi:hypothetical protein